MKRIKTNEHVALFAAFLIFIYLNSGISCSEPDTITPTNPFQVTLSLTGARVLNVVIDPAGYRPGEKADFTIIIQNGIADTWNDRYCVLLIDKDGILALLGNSTFSLKPNESIKDTLHTVIPPGVEESPYGINAVIPGSGTVTGTIWVGQIGDSPAGQWPTYTECAMGPLGSSEYSIDGGPY